MHVIGLDIGTTTISAIVLDMETGQLAETVNLANDSSLDTGQPWEHCQDAERIAARSLGLIDRLKARHPAVGAIGLTGQMHGIVYLDCAGQAVGPLYTWQDQRGSLVDDRGMTCTAVLSGETGYTLATGYGSVTHAYNCRHQLVPAQARCFASIQDYVGLRLTRRPNPLVHATNAASFGLFQLGSGKFDSAAIRQAGLDESFFPETTGTTRLLGYTADGIAVAVAIGDNQASFIGSVQDPAASILANVGTGSQISVWSPELVQLPGIETRPYIGSSYLLVGSTLCGGRSYALLEHFLRRCTELAGGKVDSFYPIMNEIAAHNLNLDNLPSIRPTFAGTRQDQALRGCIDNLGTDNFTPEHFIVALLEGMADELHTLYREIEPGLARAPARLIGSGNGLRLNPALCRILASKFGKPVQVPWHAEEASLGAALFASTAAQLSPSLPAAQQAISYR